MQVSLDACRWVYHKTLQVRRDAWQDRQESLSLYDTNKMLTQWKQEYPWLSRAFSQSLQEAQERIDLAFQHFFRRCQKGEKPGYPRFKGDWNKSFAYQQAWNGFSFTDDGKLYLCKIGNVKIKLHRPIEGQVKRLIVKRDTLGNWYAGFIVEFEPDLLSPTHQVVGVDVGLAHFATLSTGEKIENRRFFRKDESVLAKATPEYRKHKRVMQHIHHRIANRRQDLAHQLSRRLVNEFQIMACEDLDIQEMKDGNWRGMNQSIGDAARRQFVDFTTYQAANSGGLSPRVEPRNTTPICSGCGQIEPKDSSVGIHECPRCGLVLDRDHNAALNMLALGMQCLGSNPWQPRRLRRGAFTPHSCPGCSFGESIPG